MPPLVTDHSLIAHAFCFCPFAVTTTIPRRCVPWLALRIALVVEAVAGFLLSVSAVLLVYCFPALVQAKPPPAPADRVHPKLPKRRPKPTPVQTSPSALDDALPLDVKSPPGSFPSPAITPPTTPTILVTSERIPPRICTPTLPTVPERMVFNTPPSLPPSLRRPSPPLSEENHSDTVSLHSSVTSEPSAEPSTKRCCKAAIGSLSRGRPVSMPPMERSHSMCSGKDAIGSAASPHRHHRISMRSMRTTLISEPLRLLSLESSPRGSEKASLVRKETLKEKRRGKEQEKEKDFRSKRAVTRTDPYAAPFFFPSPASPDADKYVSALRERPPPTFSPGASPSPPTSAPSPSLLPATPIASGSTKGKRRLFGSHKRNMSDDIS